MDGTNLTTQQSGSQRLPQNSSISAALARLAAECVARNQLKSGTEIALVRGLVRDLEYAKPEHALEAIREHRLASPFFPHVSDLTPTLRSLEAKEARAMDRDSRDRAVIRYMIDDVTPERAAEITAFARGRGLIGPDELIALPASTEGGGE